MPKLGRSLGVAGLPNRILDVYFSSGPAGKIFTSPTETGSAVTIESESPFTGGGFSYLFTESDNSYLDFAADPSWALGTNDFTIEWFQKQTTPTGFQRVFTIDDYPDTDIGVSIENGIFYYWVFSNTYIGQSIAPVYLWKHFALVRINGVTKLYIDGQFNGLVGNTDDFTNTTDPLTIGNENLSNRTGQAGSTGAFRGYITNFRWVKGLGVYTGNFTKPTSDLALTANANPYGGSNTVAIPQGYTKLLLIPTTTDTSRIITNNNDFLITDDSKYIIYGT
jgi:hypothetical protein